MRLRPVVLVSAALAATGGAAVAAPDPERTESPPPGFGQRQAPVETVEPDQAAHYAVLRRSVSAQDRMPEGFWRNAGDTGESPSLARRATVTRSGAAVYVVPARGQVCLKISHPGSAGGGGTCNRTADALRGYLVGVSTAAGGPSRWYGLVPDGVDEVELTDDTGAVERLLPEGNVFVLETVRGIRLVRWGNVAVPIPAM